jgi:methylated-DNA-[protein]-cysteine S-methyltransferase
MNATFDTFPTAFGAFSIAVNADGALLGTAFGDARTLQARIPAYHLSQDAARGHDAREQVLAFFAGKRRTFQLAMAEFGTAFQRRVWTELCRIPVSETRTYGEIAAAIGQPRAARAVGRANALNPVCLIVPCHRVIGANGALTGFAFGAALKQRLLDHERAFPH